VNIEALVALGQRAHAWAKAYIAVKEALQVEGVTLEEARDEARAAANFAAHWPDADDDDGEPCPLCGRGNP